MNITSDSTLQRFKNLVGVKFQLYNSLFTALPFHRIESTSVLLSLFLLRCEDGFRKEQSPLEIVDNFLNQYTSYVTEQERTDLLFRIVQYAERQVVLFDALEDAAFGQLNDLNGPGTLKQLQSQVQQTNKENELAEKVKSFSVRLVLTAHPTQFYPGEVLGIIHDLAASLVVDDAPRVNTYLQQLARTPFFKQQKPTPYDEAISLLWYLENVFYPASGQVLSEIKNKFPDIVNEKNPVIRMGFWPGGDRDGNPFVNAATTIRVAEALRNGIIRCYYQDVRALRRRLTFKGIFNVLSDLEKDLYNCMQQKTAEITQESLLKTLNEIRKTLVEEYNGMFIYMLDNVISKIEIFGTFFATLDIRQDSSVHEKLFTALAEKTKLLPVNYASLNEQQKIDALLKIKENIAAGVIDNPIQQDVLESFNAIKTIQEMNGEQGCNRYIISHCTSALNMIEVFTLCKLSGWENDSLPIDIIPLFETIEDLQHAGNIMKALYENKIYRRHLKHRNNAQTIMLGFSDGTKDGGYLMANWSIYKAKELLTDVSRQYNVEVIFFDGRGGPPARGGGKTNKFYASMGHNIANKEIQLTVQGQTVSSNFGTIDAAQFNIEQLINAGISNDLFSQKQFTLSSEEEALMAQLSEESLKSYNLLKNHPNFLEYLSEISPLRFYSATNIGSRPAKRNNSKKLSLNDLRAIPYVGSWSQLKQNVTGYYGLGTALEQMEKTGKWEQVKALYRHSLFFRTLIDNSEMSMKKCFFPLTAYLAKDPKFGEIWK
ncbi:MAG: phosphoenolpyruvate carboxylase, partial [Chitinophagaceae bacterium]|nr:phosphoenolpyruvate carboxylase [Chitinophagaceae bacterium]